MTADLCEGARRGCVLRLCTLLALAFACALTGGCAYMGAQARGAELIGERIAYKVAGREGWEISALRSDAGEEARLVIYIHGTPGDATVWRSYLERPVAGTTSVAIDRPGFGRTRPRGAVASLEDQAAAIEPLLVERAGGWPILVGHSLGGPIAARIAADYPDRVGGVVIVSGAMDPTLERVLFVQRMAELPFLSMLLPRWLRNTNRELLPLKRELEMLEALLTQIHAPVVIVHGTDDRLVPVENTAYLSARLRHNPRVFLVTIVGGNHFLPANEEAAVRDAVTILMTWRKE